MDVKAGGSVEDRVAFVFSQMRHALHNAGREEGSVQLVAATKSVPIDRIRKAMAAGVMIAGENRLQEALPKIEALKEERIVWHFIGRLQRRKVRSVVGMFDLVHSVDSLDLALEIDRRAEAAGVRQNILLEINVGAERSKGGFMADDVIRTLPQLAALDHVAVQGLMAIPPPARNAEDSRPYFRKMRELAGRLAQQDIPHISMTELSMGMSNDYLVAIQEGATMIRLGTALFGGRRE
jgi:pyridoxal phosphate enzyme (YggS family)